MLSIWTSLLGLALLFGHGEGESCRPGAQDIVPNVAQGHNASQSSTYSDPANPVAGKAVDGVCSGNLVKDASCSHTNADLEPWWFVDLGEPCIVMGITIKNREDCCAERLQGAKVRVGYSVGANCKNNALCGSIYDISPGAVNTIQCNSIVGQFVCVDIPNRSEYLTLCEVEVYAMKVADVCPHASACRAQAKLAGVSE